MEACEHIDKCTFFSGRMSNQPFTLKLFKDRYCTREKNNCARYVVSSKLGENCVPNDLLPNQIEKAYSILTSNPSSTNH